jgi:hypothetical protein
LTKRWGSIYGFPNPSLKSSTETFGTFVEGEGSFVISASIEGKYTVGILSELISWVASSAARWGVRYAACCVLLKDVADTRSLGTEMVDVYVAFEELEAVIHVCEEGIAIEFGG